MRRACIAVAGVYLLAVSGAVLANPFIGSWELVSGEFRENGKTMSYQSLDLKALKVISENRYAFITVSGDEFWSSGGGVYAFDGRTYTETPVHSSYEIAPGTRYRFHYRMEGDLWHSERVEAGVTVEREVWRKLE